MAATIIESAEGHSNVQDVEFGTVYRWCPEHVVLECDCGRNLTLTSSMTTCWCGADHTTVVRETLAARRSDEAPLRPWRYTRDREDARILTNRVGGELHRRLYAAYSTFAKRPRELFGVPP